MCISGATIVYVGSAPGDAWLSALEKYPNVHQVISIDPRPIVAHSDARVKHHSIAVRSPDDMYSLLSSHDSCVLIWDVRGDANVGSERDAMILEEISVLNQILQDERLERHFFLVHLKINMRHCTSYVLPGGGRFYIQPFTLSRGVFEARYVAHLRYQAFRGTFSPSETLRSSIINEMSEARRLLGTGELSEHSLLANALVARYRQCDYIREESYDHSSGEVVLFSMNHNPPGSVVTYLKELKRRKKPYFVSFFTEIARGDDPYLFPEGEALSEGLGTVLDSRSIIPAKIEGIYFLLCDSMNDLFKEEEYTSETYRIRKTEYALNTRSRSAVYDSARVQACAEVGADFPKFPRSFGIADALLSPSGRALRMAIEFFNGNISIAMFTEKIICNFRNVARKYVKSGFGRSQVKPEDSHFASTLRNHGKVSSHIERSDHAIWHSVREWPVGMNSSLKVQTPSLYHREQSLTYLMVCFNVRVPESNERFYRNAFLTQSPLTAPRRTRASRVEAELDDGSLLNVCCLLWRTLRENADLSPVYWLSRKDPNPRTASVWREVIYKLRADACARDYMSRLLMLLR